MTAAALLAGALVLAGCGSDDPQGAELSVSSAYMPQPVSDTMAAGFLTIANNGGEQARLTSVTSDIGEVTVHETEGNAMREVDSLAVPAHGKLELSSGGNHLMFEKLKRKPKEGEKVTLELHFTGLSPVDVEIPVKSATYNPDSGN
ncbi:copper chaperone PCu(A)C [Streptomyces sp. NPDC088387]|uniref:copper chaperone PCu(A)C n=1 Tax=Streptomyces sp. NPDC088387 TaxID=3365859 RepID=UPI003802DDC3